MKLLNLKVKLDLSKLIMNGQSFGGSTAVRVAKSEPRAKAVLTMDPWFFPNKEEMAKGDFHGINKPMFFVNTERFINVSTEENALLLKNFKSFCSSPEDVTTLDCEHDHLHDIICIHPIELELPWFLKSCRPPKYYNYELLQLHSWLQLSFLHRIGFNHGTFDPKIVESNIDKYREKHVKYV